MRTDTPRFEAVQVTAVEWIIHDHNYGPDDARHIVACLWQADVGELEVTQARAVPLARWYNSVDAVLQDLYASTSMSTKPIPIAHRPPPLAQAL